MTIATGVAIPLLSSSGQKVLDAHEPGGPPVKVDSVALQSNVDLKGDSFAFPQPVTATPDQLRDISPFDLGSWARPRGGVDVGMVMAQIVLTGNRKTPIRILDMRAASKCSAPLTGTLFYSPTAGVDDTIRVAFNLDQPNPQARVWSGWEKGFGDLYFDSKTVSLKHKEQQTFQVLGITEQKSCEFRIQLSVLTGGKTVTKLVGNGSKPFKVTALMEQAKAATGDFSDYHQLYVGGVENLEGRGAFTKVDPATYKTGSSQPAN
ncbi:hypothetical protein [Actinomadura rifamycini]|uniref:hypothetical protein n=1 Tax=Actinomadura rifamycini TaxID=31962 RepID=UPI0012FA80A5|nr:hypothetical protein [Actinomadura rifamycini]